MEAARSLEKLKQFKLSQSARNITDKATAETLPEGPSITVATFLWSAIVNKGPANTAAQLASELFAQRLQGYRFGAVAGLAEPSTALSPGLWQAFESAVALRGETKGNDPYVGIRYLLFEILTSPKEPLASDRRRLLQALGVDEAMAAHRIAKFCWDYREAPEREEVWNRVFAERGLDPVNPPVGPKAGVALLQPDDPWLKDIADRAEATAEARAFAATITAAQFQPPMAVGVFGDWGSGKSFFMRLLHRAVDDQTALGAARKGDGTVTFLENVVQVRFNAWHYAETNLWASLVEHIFTCLDRWAEARNKKPEADRAFERLATARRLTVEAAEALIERRRERNAAALRLADAAAELVKREAELEAKPATYVEAAWKSLVGSGDDARRKQQAALKQAGERLGLGDLSASAGEFRIAAAALDSELAKQASLRSGTLRALAAPVVVVAVVAGTVALPLLLAALTEAANASIPPVAAAISGAVAPLALALHWAAGQTSRALGTVQQFRAKFEESVAVHSTGARDKEEAARRDLAAAEAAQLEARERLAQATGLAAEAARTYNAETGKGRVLGFVRERLEAGEYAKQLSFVATVRKDFEELSRLMTSTPEPPAAANSAKLHEAHVGQLVAQAKKEKLLGPEELEKLKETTRPPEKGPAVFERIVLYIDDLDRCPPKGVVAVLQAIHLLLTFPLFVVFVAVDVRWLRHALAVEYAGQIKNDDEDAAIASAGDYLEKIFQVPFWVRAMGATNTRAILEDRMGPPDATNDFVGVKAESEGENRGAGAAETASVQAEPTAAHEPEGEPSLRLTAEERKFITEIAGALDGSPRRTLRFINTYRIVKASFGPAELRELEGGGFRAFASLLAIAVSADQIYPVVVRLLGAATEDPLADVLKAEPVANSPHLKSVEEAFRCFRTGGGDAPALLRYADLVGRFSFHPANRPEPPAAASA